MAVDVVPLVAKCNMRRDSQVPSEGQRDPLQAWQLKGIAAHVPAVDVMLLFEGLHEPLASLLSF